MPVSHLHSSPRDRHLVQSGFASSPCHFSMRCRELIVENVHFFRRLLQFKQPVLPRVLFGEVASSPSNGVAGLFKDMLVWSIEISSSPPCGWNLCITYWIGMLCLWQSEPLLKASQADGSNVCKRMFMTLDRKTEALVRPACCVRRNASFRPSDAQSGQRGESDRG